jgi:spermidine synthase
MLHPNPERALVIGWGTGSTAGSAGLYPSLKQIDCVEIEPLMFASRNFFADIDHNIAADPRFKIHIQDGRNYLLTTPTSYDVILSEPSNPWITGVSNLFTKDFYSISKSRLSPGGIFCQWFHYYNVSLQDMRVQTRTFAESFPYASVWLVPPRPADMGNPVLFGDILFIGSDKPCHLDYERVRHWYGNKAIREDLVPLGGVEDELAFLTNYFMNRDDMLRFGNGAPDNTDNFPYLEFSAPKRLYVAQSEAQQSIAEIYQHFDAGGSEQFPPIENYPPLTQKNLSKSQHADLCVLIGSNYLRKAFMSRARRLAETAIKEDDRNGGAYALLGEALYDQGLVSEAENLFVRALDLNPKLRRAYHLLGAAYYNRKEFAKSKQVFSLLAQNFPDDPIGYYGQAVICTELHDWSEARELVDKTLSIDPGLEDAIKLRDYLRQIK